MDTVSTGSGSDLVSDQIGYLLTIFDSHRLTRSLPLPVLTVSKTVFGLQGKALFKYSAYRQSKWFRAVSISCIVLKTLLQGPAVPNFVLRRQIVEVEVLFCSSVPQ